MHAKSGHMNNMHGNGFAARSGNHSLGQREVADTKDEVGRRRLTNSLRCRGRSFALLATFFGVLASGAQAANWSADGDHVEQGSGSHVASHGGVQKSLGAVVGDHDMPQDEFVSLGLDARAYDQERPEIGKPGLRFANAPEGIVPSVVRQPEVMPVDAVPLEVGAADAEPTDVYDVVWPSRGVARPGHLTGLFGAANPRWEFTADALLLWQGNVTNRVFYTDATGSALDAAQGQTPLSVGPRFGLMLNLDQERAVELNYFQTSPFQGEQTTPPSDAAYTMNDLAGFDLSGVSGASFETDALIQSFEANWRRGNGGPVTWLVGFRWVEWNQSLAINDTAGQYIDTFNTNVGNDLYGAQIGLDAMLWNRDGAISIDSVAKAGVYYNNAYQQISAYEGVARGPLRAAADETSFFGELGITMDTRITDWLSWRLGYSAFWLSGVAEAAGQLSSTNLQLPVPPPATINTSGSVLLHGVTTGIEARW